MEVNVISVKQFFTPNLLSPILYICPWIEIWTWITHY